jgi:hypothetical protein
LSTRMLLEGTDIRALLAQIRDEYGPDVRIVHAERIRSGGVGGFFAKQRFEVAVELDDEVAAAGLHAAGGPHAMPPTAAQFAAAFPEQASALGSSLGSSGDAAPLPGSAERSTIAPARAAAPVAGEPLRTFDETVAALAAAHAPASSASAVDLVLGSLPSLDEPLSAASRTMPSASSALPSLVPSALISRGPLDELPVERAVRESFPDGLVTVGPRLAAPEPDADLAARLHEQRTAALAAAASSIAPTAAGDLPRGQVYRGLPVDEPAAPHLAPVVTLPTSHTAEAAEPAPAPAPVAPPVPSRPGEVLVLLGEPEAGFRSAVALAAKLRIPARAVSVLSVRDDLAVPETQLLHDLLEARLRGATLAHDRTAGIVVIDSPIDLATDPVGAAWVADAVAAVGGSATWALVDATRRTEDLQRWIDCLPGPVALAVHNHAAACDPHEVERLSLPVAVADGVPVTPARPAAPAPAAPADTLADTAQRRTS